MDTQRPSLCGVCCVFVEFADDKKNTEKLLFYPLMESQVEDYMISNYNTQFNSFTYYTCKKLYITVYDGNTVRVDYEHSVFFSTM